MWQIIRWWFIYRITDFLFWFKHWCGFVDLRQNITVTGKCIRLVRSNDDGDLCLDIRPDLKYEWTMYYHGILTHEDSAEIGTLHTEYMPSDQTQQILEAASKLEELLKKGEQPRIKISGRWGYDGVHLPGVPKWKLILLCILGHKPVPPPYGWVECHRAKTLEIL